MSYGMTAWARRQEKVLTPFLFLTPFFKVPGTFSVPNVILNDIHLWIPAARNIRIEAD
jgi:hypothetical protein